MLYRGVIFMIFNAHAQVTLAPIMLKTEDKLCSQDSSAYNVVKNKDKPMPFSSQNTLTSSNSDTMHFFPKIIKYGNLLHLLTTCELK